MICKQRLSPQTTPKMIIPQLFLTYIGSSYQQYQASKNKKK